jgi:hypothetical protein
MYLTRTRTRLKKWMSTTLRTTKRLHNDNDDKARITIVRMTKFTIPKGCRCLCWGRSTRWITMRWNREPSHPDGHALWRSFNVNRFTKPLAFQMPDLDPKIKTLSWLVLYFDEWRPCPILHVADSMLRHRYDQRHRDIKVSFEECSEPSWQNRFINSPLSCQQSP